MTYAIDVHVLHLPTENRQWVDECNQSLISEPINIFHLDGIKGDIRQARYNGYTKGTAPYVSFVDPDDYVYPGTFQKCLDVLEQHPECCGVYTLSNIDYENGDIKPNHEFRDWSPRIQYVNTLEIHQIVVMRRDLILKCYEDYFDDMPLTVYHEMYSFMRLAMLKPWISIDYIGYCWRKRSTGCHASEWTTSFPPSLTALRREFCQFYQIR